jgi:putative ABC transport system ATP-binding protein
VTVLKGPSGSGKTTLLSLVGLMARPTSGRIHLETGGKTREMTSLPERFMAEIRRTTFGFVFQSFNLVRGVSALENVMLPAYPLGGPHREVKARAHELLTRFGIGSKASNPVEDLSGGEKQRVAIARALINDPTYVIADEPTAHLDTALAAEFMDLVAALVQENRTLIIASHDPLVAESPIVSRVVAMRDGRLTKE